MLTMPSTIAAEPRSVSIPEKKHVATPIAAERLHRRVVDQFDRMSECTGVVRPDPPGRPAGRLCGIATGRLRSTGRG